MVLRGLLFLFIIQLAACDLAWPLLDMVNVEIEMNMENEKSSESESESEEKEFEKIGIEITGLYDGLDQFVLSVLSDNFLDQYDLGYIDQPPEIA